MTSRILPACLVAAVSCAHGPIDPRSGGAGERPLADAGSLPLTSAARPDFAPCRAPTFPWTYGGTRNGLCNLSAHEGPRPVAAVDGTFFLATAFNAPLRIGQNALATAGISNLVARLGIDGQLLWARPWPASPRPDGTLDSTVRAMASNPAGALAIVVSFAANHGRFDFGRGQIPARVPGQALLRFDGSGNPTLQLWRANGSEPFAWTQVWLQSGGGFMVAGERRPDATETLSSSLNVLFTYDPAGHLIDEE